MPGLLASKSLVLRVTSNNPPTSAVAQMIASGSLMRQWDVLPDW